MSCGLGLNTTKIHPGIHPKAPRHPTDDLARRTHVHRDHAEPAPWWHRALTRLLTGSTAVASAALAIAALAAQISR
jgi:hypothetical protein